MIVDKRYCIEILNQIKAVKSGLNRVGSKVFEKHFRGCITQVLSKKNGRKSYCVDEISQVVGAGKFSENFVNSYYFRFICVILE